MIGHELVACALFGTIAGVLSGFLGIGGGAILPPLLVFALGIGQHRAQAISLAALLPPVGLPAVLAYRRQGVHFDARLVAYLVAGFVAGAAGGAWLAHRVPSRELAWLFAGFLALSAWRAVARVPEEEARARAAPPHNRPWAIAIGAAAGILSGLLGIGGGLVALPLLRRLGLGRLEAQATTLAMLLPPIGLPAVLVYATEQRGLPWPLLGAVGLGFAAGAAAGARLAGKANARAAAFVYAGFLVVMAIVLAFHA